MVVIFFSLSRSVGCYIQRFRTGVPTFFGAVLRNSRSLVIIRKKKELRYPYRSTHLPATTEVLYFFLAEIFLTDRADSSTIASFGFTPFHYSTIPLFHHSTIPLFHYSTLPLFHYPTIPHFHYSTIPLFHYVFHYSTIPLFHSFTLPLVHSSTVPMFHSFTVPYFHCSIFPLFHCSTIPLLFRCSTIYTVTLSQV